MNIVNQINGIDVEMIEDHEHVQHGLIYNLDGYEIPFPQSELEKHGLTQDDVNDPSKHIQLMHALSALYYDQCNKGYVVAYDFAHNSKYDMSDNVYSNDMFNNQLYEIDDDITASFNDYIYVNDKYENIFDGVMIDLVEHTEKIEPDKPSETTQSTFQFDKGITGLEENYLKQFEKNIQKNAYRGLYNKICRVLHLIRSVQSNQSADVFSNRNDCVVMPIISNAPPEMLEIMTHIVKFDTTHFIRMLQAQNVDGMIWYMNNHYSVDMSEILIPLIMDTTDLVFDNLLDYLIMTKITTHEQIATEFREIIRKHETQTRFYDLSFKRIEKLYQREIIELLNVFNYIRHHITHECYYGNITHTKYIENLIKTSGLIKLFANEITKTPEIFLKMCIDTAECGYDDNLQYPSDYCPTEYEHLLGPNKNHLFKLNVIKILDVIYSNIPYSVVFNVIVFVLYFEQLHLIDYMSLNIKQFYNVLRYIVTKYDVNESSISNNNFVKVNENFVKMMIMNHILYDSVENESSQENVIELLDTHGFHFTKTQLSQLRRLSTSFRTWIDEYTVETYTLDSKKDSMKVDECDEPCMVCDMGTDDGVIIRRLPCFHTHVLCVDCIKQLHKTHDRYFSEKCKITHIYQALCETCTTVFVSDNVIVTIQCPMCRQQCQIELYDGENDEKNDGEEDGEAEQPNGGGEDANVLEWI
jgi:hypothetical protein